MTNNIFSRKTALFSKRIFILFGMLVCCAVFLLVGCKKKAGSVVTSDSENGEYMVYYSNVQGTKLVGERFVPETKSTESYESRVTDMTDGENAAYADNTTEELISALIQAMKKPVNPASQKSTFTPQITILDIKLENGLLSVYFADTYSELSSSEEIMFRASFVKTLTQINDIKYVCFYVNGQPLTDVLGNTVGVMLSSDFLEDSGSSTNSLSLATLSIYYSNENADKLVPETVTVTYGRNASVERVIIEQLVKGPSEEGHLRTLPETLALLSVSTKEGICYVNFDSAIVTNLVGVSAEMTVFSIVNSLCELPNVNKVQISINGESNVNYRDSVDLSHPYERNLDIIENTVQ